MAFTNNDAAFYGNDASINAPRADLSGQIPYDGTRARMPNTGSRYLNQVGIIDNTASVDSSGQPCDWINTKFNARHNGKYEVEVRDGNIYVTTEGGQQRLAQPQAYAPDYRAERARRDMNYYADDSWDAQSQPNYRPMPQRDYPYQPTRQFDAAGLLFGLGLGVLTHGRGFGYGGYRGGYDYDRYRSNPIGVVGYNPAGFMPVSTGWAGSPGWGGNRWGNQYSWNQNNWNVNPQYTSGYYPGTYYNS